MALERATLSGGRLRDQRAGQFELSTNRWTTLPILEYFEYESTREKRLKNVCLIGSALKRQVKRERALPAFILTIGDLEALWARLVPLFGLGAKIYSSIDIGLGSSEQIQFLELSELKAYPHLPSKIANFTIWLSHDDRIICIRSGRHFAIKSCVSVVSESEAWSAGAIETVYSFLQSHKLWYSLYLSTPVGWILFVFANISSPIFISSLLKDGVPPALRFAWLGLVVALCLLYLGREKILPSGIIMISNQGGFLKNHVAELSLIVGTISLVVTVIQLFK